MDRHDPKDQTIQNLEAEISALQRQLQSQAQTHQGQLPISLGNVGRVAPVRKYQPISARRVANEANRQLEKLVPEPVFKHLGRLVCPENGVDQFAGSSTGVHFTLSAQTQYQCLLAPGESFPETVFSLYLLSRYSIIDSKPRSWWMSSDFSLRAMFPQSEAYYKNEMEKFFEHSVYLYVS
jgi:hypothetical protein